MDLLHNGTLRSLYSWVVLIGAVLGFLGLEGKQRVAFADEPTAPAQRAAEIDVLLEQLSSSQFDLREAASQRLLNIGPEALDQLQKMETHPSLEVRERAERVASEIDKLVFERVTKNFLLDTDGSQSYGLPAWGKFQEIAGDSRTSKLLFIMMLRSQRDLAKSIEAAVHAAKTPAAAASHQALEKRLSLEAIKLQSKSIRGRMPEVGDTVGLMLACSMFEETAPNEATEVIVGSLYRVTMGDYFLKPGYSRCMRSISGRWITKTHSAIASDVLAVAMQRGIPEGAIVARRHLNESNEQVTRVRALQCLSRFGNASDIPNIEVYLKDETVVLEFMESSSPQFAPRDIQEEFRAPPGLKQKQVLPSTGRTMITRFSDLTLAVCMILNSENVQDVYPNFLPNDIQGVSVMDLGMPANEVEKHKLAISKWQESHPRASEKRN